jgi:hypothetical protein
MTATHTDTQDSRLLSYVIASGDMRHIPVNERELYLRTMPDNRLFIRGEIPGCGVNCIINLSQILFEYAVSCEDCKDHITSAESEARFGRHLGRVFTAELNLHLQEMPVADRLVEAMAIILRSIDVRFSTDRATESIRFDLVECPIHKAADEPGYSLRLPIVHLGFAALCESVLEEIAPGWKMVNPIVKESDAQVRIIHFARP